MNPHLFGCLMTAKDFEICENMLAAISGSPSRLLPLLRAKLAAATVVAAEYIDPLTVTLNSRVEFQPDGGSPQARIVVRNEFQNGLVGLTLPISTLRGLALLGMRQGQALTVDDGGRSERILVRRTLYQPEAARFGRVATAVARVQQARPVHSAKIIDFTSIRGTGAAQAARKPASAAPSSN